MPPVSTLYYQHIVGIRPLYTVILKHLFIKLKESIEHIVEVLGYASKVLGYASCAYALITA